MKLMVERGLINEENSVNQEKTQNQKKNGSQINLKENELILLNQNNQQIPYNQQGINNQLGYYMDEKQGLMLNGLPVVPYNMNPLKDPISSLEICKDVYIKQTVEWRDLVSGCDSKFCFIIFSESNNTFNFLFKVKDHSGFCMRNCCCCNHRSYNIILSSSFPKNVVTYIRPYKCICFCCCCCKKNDMINQYYEGNKFGKIEEPTNGCDPYYRINDENDNPKYILKLNCCQCGFCCRGNCDSCGEVNGYIYKCNDMNNIVGNIYQKEGYCHKEFTTIDTYHLTFPNDANINDKLNLIGAVVLMNYTYYAKSNFSGQGYALN